MAATRRNGQIASCEPCRKSKLRCDHSTPICDRCARRGKSELCVYHPAPLTRQKSPLDGSATPRPRKRLHVEGQRPEIVVEKNNAPSLQSPDSTATGIRSYGSEGILRDQQIANWTRKRSSFSTPGFLGLTSYSAVFSENEGNLGVATHGSAELGARDFSSIDAGSVLEDDPRQVQLGAQLLLLLDDLELYERIAETWFEVSEGCVLGTPIIRMMFKFLKETYHAWIKDSTDRYSSMLAFSKKIFDNGSNSIDFNSSTTPREYISLISGLNTRWEIIGLVFSIMGLGAVLAPPWDSIFKREGKPIVDKKDLGIVATAAGDICLQFCDNGGIVNDPLSWLLFQHSHLLTLVYGDNGGSSICFVSHWRPASNVLNRLPPVAKTR
jgi:chromatin structure-remodeling complex subunit RSC3/30